MVPREIMLQGLNVLHSPAMLSVAEAEFLYDTAAGLTSPPIGDKWLLWVELGVWCGRSLWAAGCAVPKWTMIYGYDLCSGELPTREGSSEIIRFAPGKLQGALASAVAESVQLERGTGVMADVFPEDSAEASRNHPSRAVDVLVVDAAHDYESVCRDLDAWLPKMKPGGLIIGHDYGGRFEGVTRAFDERFGDKCQQVPGTRFVKVQL